MLKVNHVTKDFERFVLEDISFEVPPGYICGLVGENGSGKTTLIKIICGMYDVTEGEVKISGAAVNTEECVAKNKTGVVLNDDMFESWLSLENNAKMFGRYYRNYSHDKLCELLKEFSLEPQRKYHALSKGEKLKFALAFALSYDPELLILDEPAANFDPEFRNIFNNLLRDFTSSGEKSVILSTHIMADAEKFSDYLLMLREGRQLIFGDIETVRNSYRMVSGELSVIEKLGDRIISVNENELGCTALVRNNGTEYSEHLETWEPSVEEIMCYFSREGER